MPVIHLIVIVSPASVVSSSKHQSVVLQFKDSAETSVVVVRSFWFKSSSVRMDSAGFAGVE